MDELLEEFIAETRETLEALAGQLVEWEQNPQDRALLDSVFRFVHTVKGSCGFLDLPRLMRLSHAAEDLLSSARDGAVSASPELVTAVLDVIDKIAALTDALETGQAIFDNDEQLIEAMLAFVGGAGHRAAPTAKPLRPDIMAAGEIGEPAHLRAKSRTVRVSLSLLDKLMNGVSDMVLARNEVSRQMRKAGTNSELDHAFTRLSASVAEMRDAVGLMRMQNIDRLFSSLPRLLRDITTELGKEIELRISGGEVEIDREMVEALRDPLTHILRNAADHGIERSDERLAMGKDPVGQIRINARQSGNQILIEIVDDGRGIDVDKLGARVVAAKMATASEWQRMPERAKLNMIFMPGLSTADKVSAISGRGVGMDVVRSNLQAVGGSIDLENYEGQGLKTTLRLPLTLSIIAGLSVRAGDQIFGISRNSVVELISASNSNVKIEQVGGAQIACIRGERYPYAKLESVLDLAEVDGEESSRTLVVMRPAVGATFVLDVAKVIDNEELVVKPGANLVMGTGLYAGTSLPDNGKPMLLLDASGLASAIGVDTQSTQVDADEEVVAELAVKRASALLFIASDGVKRAARLSVIDRLEDIPVEQIKFVGGKMRASIGDDLIDTCELDEIPSSGLVKALRLTDGEIVRLLAVNDVLDIFTLDADITPSATPDLHEGVVNAFGELIELINIFRYFEEAHHAERRGSEKPLCFIASEADSHWEQRILAPLLTASGYEVSFDRNDLGRAAVVLERGASAGQGEDPRVLHLRDTSHALDDRASIYRYDRIGLISAIEAKLAGAA